MSKFKTRAWYNQMLEQQKTATWNNTENQRGEQTDAKAEEYRKRRANSGKLSLLGSGKSISSGVGA